MKTLALVTGACLLGSAAAMAGEPVALTDQQLDAVNAGLFSFASAAAGANATTDLGLLGATAAKTETNASTTSTSSAAGSSSVAASDLGVLVLFTDTVR
jgi:hypothetical protein